MVDILCRVEEILQTMQGRSLVESKILRMVSVVFKLLSPKGATSFPDRGSYEYDQIRVSSCLLCL